MLFRRRLGRFWRLLFGLSVSGLLWFFSHNELTPFSPSPATAPFRPVGHIPLLKNRAPVPEKRAGTEKSSSLRRKETSQDSSPLPGNVRAGPLLKGADTRSVGLPRQAPTQLSLPVKRVKDDTFPSATDAETASRSKQSGSDVFNHGWSWEPKLRNNSAPTMLSSSPFILGKLPGHSNVTRVGQKRQVHAHVRPNRTKLVLFYNMPRWFTGNTETAFQGCPVDACALTVNRSLLHQADAVMFHVFFFTQELPPKRRPKGQIWVAFGLEPPYALGSNMLTLEWSGSFNWTMTYRMDSDLFTPYGKLVYRGEQKKNYSQLGRNKRKSAAWFVSNCRTPSRRLAYVKRLQRHYPVDIFGRCGTLRCPRSRNCLSLLNSTYRFYLSFENSLCRDYVTEKFFGMFRRDLHVVPVVRGGTDYGKFFPPGTFVDASRFGSPRSLARHLRKLESDTDLYAAMLKEKDKYYAAFGRKEPMCRLCEKLHVDDPPSQTYPSLAAWMKEGVCSVSAR